MVYRTAWFVGLNRPGGHCQVHGRLDLPESPAGTSRPPCGSPVAVAQRHLVRPHPQGFASFHNISPLVIQETPKAHSAKASSQKTGLRAATAESLKA